MTPPHSPLSPCSCLVPSALSILHTDSSGALALTAPEYWTVAVVILGLILWATLWRTNWREAAGWTALALAGQACALQLLWVGNTIHLQVFQSWWVLLKTHRAAYFGVVLAQAALASWGARKLWARHALRLFSWWQAILLLVLWTYASTTIAPGVAQAFVYGGFAHQFLVQATKFALGLLVFGAGALNLALAAAAIPADGVDRIAARWAQFSGRNPRILPLLCALWVVVVSSLLAWLALDRIPHLADETAYLFQAKHIAAGRLTLPPPADPKALYCPFQIIDGAKWYNAAPAGWSFFLALGVFAGVPWLVNPLLGGIAVLLSHSVVRRLYNRDLADGVAFLLAVSPWLLFLSASLMPHPTTLVLSMAGLLGVVRARSEDSIAGAALAGFCFGALLHVRPLEAVIMAAVSGVWWVAAGWRKFRFAALCAAAAGGLFMTALFLAYNQHLTGDPLQVPINKYADTTYQEGVNRLGFGPNVGNVGWTGLDALPGHGPIDVIMNTNQNLHLIQFEMFGWACGSLLFAFPLLVWRHGRGDGLMWWLIAAVAGTMSLYWFSGGPDFGARYWYQMIVPFTVLTLRGALEFRARWNSRASHPGDENRVWLFVALASLLAVINIIPWRSIDKYHQYRGMRPDFRELARRIAPERSLVFVRGKLRPDYLMAHPFNPPVYDRDVTGTVFAHELDAESVARLRAYYSDRPVWIVAGVTLTGAAPQVVAGPIAPGQPYPLIPRP